MVQVAQLRTEIERLEGIITELRGQICELFLEIRRLHDNQPTQPVMRNDLFHLDRQCVACRGRCRVLTKAARRVCFAIDISGSMDESTSFGQSRLEVVKTYLRRALKDMENVPDAAFGIGLFSDTLMLPLGPNLLATDSSSIVHALDVVTGFRAAGSNGAEGQCLDACLSMQPDAIFFLGDGGWDSACVLASAQRAAAQKVKIHSIPFFMDKDGGMLEASRLTHGSFHKVDSPSDLDSAPN